MILSRVTAPTETPVSLAEAKAHLAVTHSSDDTLIQLLLDAAVAQLDGAEGALGRCLVTQTWDYTIDRFPFSAGCWNEINVPLPTLQSVTSVKYYDPEGVQRTMDPSAYVVSGQKIVPVDAWPDYDTTRPGAVTVRFVAGYGAATDVPANAKALILLLTEDFYRKRGATDSEAFFANPAVARLIGGIKKVRV
jgi:uncharacterized phiE125 gp8 family phage protein